MAIMAIRQPCMAIGNFGNCFMELCYCRNSLINQLLIV